MAILFTSTLRVFARNLLRGNREEILFVFRFGVRPGARTLALRLIRQHTTYGGLNIHRKCSLFSSLSYTAATMIVATSFVHTYSLS